MNEQLEKYIDFALADGVLTDKEKKVLQRKAQELGVDQDEFEMVLDAKLHLAQKAATPPPPPQSAPEAETPKSNKEGDIKKCPSCGAIAQSFTTKCSDCGYEFRNTKGASSIQKLYDEFQKIEESERSRKRSSWAQKIEGDLGIQRSVVTRQISALTAFPVPNTKEDLLEFLSIASSEAGKKASWFVGAGQHPDYILKKAWLSKCEQVIKKARFSMKDDKSTLAEFETYAKQLKIK